MEGLVKCEKEEEEEEERIVVGYVPQQATDTNKNIFFSNTETLFCLQ